MLLIIHTYIYIYIHARACELVGWANKQASVFSPWLYNSAWLVQTRLKIWPGSRISLIRCNPNWIWLFEWEDSEVRRVKCGRSYARLAKIMIIGSGRQICPSVKMCCGKRITTVAKSAPNSKNSEAVSLPLSCLQIPFTWWIDHGWQFDNVVPMF